MTDILWPKVPEELSTEAQDLIANLLHSEPAHRPTVAAIKAHAFFASVDWDHLRERPAPFVPRPSDNMDTSYFDCASGARCSARSLPAQVVV